MSGGVLGSDILSFPSHFKREIFKMSRGIVTTGLCLLSALNVAVLIINMSSPSMGEPSTGEPSNAAPSKAAPSKAAPSKAAPSKAAPSKAAPSKAAPAGNKYLRDPDFQRAVKEIIQECNVNVDLNKVEC
jgi:hypothetical protein